MITKRDILSVTATSSAVIACKHCGTTMHSTVVAHAETDVTHVDRREDMDRQVEPSVQADAVRTRRLVRCVGCKRRSTPWLMLELARAIVWLVAAVLLFAVAPQDTPPESATVDAGQDPRADSEPAGAPAEPRSAAEPELPTGPAVERQGPASPPVQRNTTSAASSRTSPAQTWEARMQDVETHARQCLDDARIEPRRVTVTLAPGELVEFTNVPEDSPHARCVGEALERLQVRADIPRFHTFFDAL